MPISRDPRTDRRRRLRLEGYDGLEQAPVSSRTKSSSSQAAEHENSRQKRSAGYSQEVRRACGQRLVQLIPVRRRAFATVVAVSLLVPGMLLLGHYMVYVVGKPRWYGHPLAILLDLSHQNGLATWLSSHLWLLCLTATVLTFQLRRHKLDDYEGEYRLWFWLVMTCLLASIDSTTKVSHLFGLALENWSQLNLGWSGPAVVQSTLIVLVGMLGLRLCTELKAVPLSLVFWLTGLVAWCASTILSQDLLRVELSAQFRMWLRCSLWLGGLTCVWLAALTYLRHVYIEAQKRFLARGRLATAAIPLRERIRESMPQLPNFRRGGESEEGEGEGTRWGIPAFWKRDAEESDEVDEQPAARRRSSRRQQQAVKTEPETQTKADAHSQAEPAASGERKPSRLTSWIRKPKDSDEPDEYKKVVRPPKSERVPNKAASESDTDSGDGEERASWFSKLPRPKLPKPSLPSFKRNKKTEDSDDQAQSRRQRPAAGRSEEDASEDGGKKKSGGFFSKLKMPSFRLPTPGEKEDAVEQDPAATGQRSHSEMKPVNQQRADLPSTEPSYDSDEEEPQRPSRPLSKAERKRLRRQKQNRAA